MEEITVILPVYNEEERLESTVKALVRSLEKIGRDYRIIIAEDGSTDKTADISSSLEAQNLRLELLHSKERIGRGASLSRAIKQSESPIVAFMDIDLSTSLACLPHIISKIEKGAVIATGSRLLPGSRVQRSVIRVFFSKAYNLLARLLTDSKIHDHQCGFKAFNREKILPLLDEVQDNHWFWDTELLVRAQRKGIKVSEIPVDWKGSDGSKVNLFFDVLGMGFKLIKLSLSL